MAAEAVIIELLGKVPGCPIRYTVSDAAAITKGTLLKVTDPRTASAHSAADQPIVGIAAEAKVANDGALSLAVYTNGIFDLTAAAAGAVAIGKICACSGTANMFTMADAADLTQGSNIGQCLEAADNDETVAVRILK